MVHPAGVAIGVSMASALPDFLGISVYTVRYCRVPSSLKVPGAAGNTHQIKDVTVLHV